jgi:hypothetical protein
MSVVAEAHLGSIEAKEFEELWARGIDVPLA